VLVVVRVRVRDPVARYGDKSENARPTSVTPGVSSL